MSCFPLSFRNKVNRTLQDTGSPYIYIYEGHLGISYVDHFLVICKLGPGYKGSSGMICLNLRKLPDLKPSSVTPTRYFYLLIAYSKTA